MAKSGGKGFLPRQLRHFAFRGEAEGTEHEATPAPLIQRHYPEVRFGGFTAVDSTIAFYTRVRALTEGAATVLDVGCGRGAQIDDPLPFRQRLRDFRAPGRNVLGIDLDKAALSNPYVDEVRLIDDDQRWPVETESVDVCVGDFVLEHVDEPNRFFAECRRVLRVGGVVCIRTVNARSYVGIGSRVTPTRLHATLVRTLQGEREAKDVFPTVYRCNTRSSLARTLRRHGFDEYVQAFDPEPAYLDRWSGLYRLGVWHQRIAPNAFGVLLLAFGRRLPAGPSKKVV